MIEKDRISKLPDPILHHILSFLSARDVVQASVLSRRWTNIWASAPYLLFQDDEAIFGAKYNGKFVRFVDMLLLLRDSSNVHKFHVSHYRVFDRHHLGMWIRYAVRRNAKVIEVDADVGDHNVDIPDCIFTCQSLEGLSLAFGREVNVNPPKFTRLCQLKRLHLSRVALRCNGMQTLISRCSVLEELKLESCCLENPDIFSHTLNSLIIQDCNLVGTIVRISVAGLLSLYYINNHHYKGLEVRILLENVSSLASATIHAGWTSCVNAVDILREVCNVSTLEFSSPCIEIFGLYDLSRLPMFHNLKRLKLGGWCMSENFKAIAYFLKQSPTLEMLALKSEEPCLRRLFNSSWNPEELSFDCLCLKMVEIQIQCSYETRRVHELVKSLLASALVLERVAVIPNSKSQLCKNCLL